MRIQFRIESYHLYIYYLYLMIDDGQTGMHLVGKVNGKVAFGIGSKSLHCWGIAKV